MEYDHHTRGISPDLFRRVPGPSRPGGGLGGAIPHLRGMLTELLAGWIACPSCGSEDVTISLSLPTGIPRVQCDDCRRRDTVAEDGQITRGHPHDDHPSTRTNPENNSNERFYAAVGAVMVGSEHLPAAAEQRGVDPAAVHQTVGRTREIDE